MKPQHTRKESRAKCVMCNVIALMGRDEVAIIWDGLEDAVMGVDVMVAGLNLPGSGALYSPVGIAGNGA